MNVGISIRFLNSYFSGALPQIALALAKSLRIAGNKVTLVYPSNEAKWFIDLQSLPHEPLQEYNESLHFDAFIEVVWSLTKEQRAKIAPRVILFVHHPPIFSDMEACTYQWNAPPRNFSGLHALWTYDFHSAVDVKYLEFLAGVPVQRIPYIWDSTALDLFVSQENIPSWKSSAHQLESMIADNVPKTMSWCARIMENNNSNTSHCVLPLNILSEIRNSGDAIRCVTHNGEQTWKSDFFKSNIARNLTLPDISGNIVPRVRLPDVRRDKVVLIAHQRFRPLKMYLLDAMHLGIPMVHNCDMLKPLGAPYHYHLNQIKDAVKAWKQCAADAQSQSGFFSDSETARRKALLHQTFSPESLSSSFHTILRATPALQPIVRAPSSSDKRKVLRVHFCTMWDQFVPQYNFFTYLLSWIGSVNDFKVELDATNPDLVFFGPYSNDQEKKYPTTPKVFFTGENLPPKDDPTVFLNLGYQYSASPNYIRLPLWVLEINWWGANVEKVVNPKPVSLQDATTVPKDAIEKKSKFCAFVATNPNNNNRNTAFHILNGWRKVDAGGRLFCNLPTGPIPAGLGGGGGELAKVNFYKDYKFALTFENSSSPGYTTEKLFHAKVAGCVPIYWGDPFVDRDFDTEGFINCNQVSNPQDLIRMVSEMEADPEKWKKAASIPALSEYKKQWCMKLIEEVGKRIAQRIFQTTMIAPSWSDALAFGAKHEAGMAVAPTPQLQVAGVLNRPTPSSTTDTSKRVFVTAANAKYIECVANALNSLRIHEPTIKKIVYVWPDVEPKMRSVLTNCGASEVRDFPTEQKPWSDFWEPQHFAWKLWLLKTVLESEPADTCVLYVDSGTVFTMPLAKVWAQINDAGVCLFDDNEQQNGRWCHPRFCEILRVTPSELAANQIWAGSVGFKKGSKFTEIVEQSYKIAHDHRDAIVGDKWKPYSASCQGHRHDQSILSVISMRHNAPRVPLRQFYNDHSLRSAANNKVPMYVHRGNFKDLIPFAEGISEAYVINLERRKDRLAKFNAMHSYMKDRVYRHDAVDGRSLTLTSDLVQLFRDNDFKWKKSVMGCALSHYGLWMKLARDNVAKSYLIMEDDVVFEPNWLVQWASVANNIPSDADVIYLGGILPPNKAAFPSAIEKVNEHFGRVAKNTTFGPQPRRYFHFCNYGYILTKSGAQKICTLIQQRGIFTSGDHMIVNHGDGLLNIYFTTPLVATCFQESDPVYQKSEFNNFNRVDNFDSDLWNNTDCFTGTEITSATMRVAPPTAATPTVAAATPKLPVLPADNSERHKMHVQTWNQFLKVVALKKKDELKASLDAIFAIWKQCDFQEFNNHMSWYRIFEQLIVTRNELLMEHKQHIASLIRSTFNVEIIPVWERPLNILEDTPKPSGPGIPTFVRPSEDHVKVYHLRPINVAKNLERQWLDAIFPHPIQYVPFDNFQTVLEATTPVIMYQHIPGSDLTKIYNALTTVFEQQKKQYILLHMSDEFGNDDIGFYKSPAIKAVIRNYWRLGLEDPKVKLIPLGYAADRHANYLPPTPGFEERADVWSFAGSMDREGRGRSLTALKSAQPHTLITKPTWSQPNVLDSQGYIEMLRKSKFVPCFRGSRALESYRIYEALEHGAIPIYVPNESHDCKDELKHVLGATHPLLGFQDWEQAAKMLPLLASKPEAMKKHCAQLQAWWSTVKADLRKQIADIIRG